VVRVEDQGPGVPQEHRERIFDRFFTYRPNDGRAREHTGLGLAIVKTVVERYGGSIALVDSSLGGAGFEVRLSRL
jgi:two-component system sensor histidine kinase ChvG